jgi:hypothetical protein
MVLVHRGDGLENHGGQQLHGADFVACMAWVTILCH